MKHPDQMITATRIPLPTMPGRVALGLLAHPTQTLSAMISLLPNGMADRTDQLAVMHRLLDRWPSRPLLISAVRVGDGRLTWFGQLGNSRSAVMRAAFLAAAGQLHAATTSTIGSATRTTTSRRTA